MKIEIELEGLENIDRSITVVQKAIDFKPLSIVDTTLLMGVKSILDGVQQELPKMGILKGPSTTRWGRNALARLDEKNEQIRELKSMNQGLREALVIANRDRTNETLL